MRAFSRHNFKLASQNLKAARGRSYLTMLGVVIGVMAVVLMVCIGQGVKQQISGQLVRYGKNAISVQPGRVDSGSILGGLSGSSSSLLNERDLKIVSKTPGVDLAVPLATSNGTITGDHTVNNPYIIATTSQFPDVIKQPFASGGFFDSDTETEGIVLGQTVARKLFDNNSPLGQGLTWRGQRFVVAGVYDDFRAAPFSLEANFNNAVFVPYATAQSLSGGVLGIYQILVKGDNAAPIDPVISRLQGNLVSAHGGSLDVTVQRATNSSNASDQTLQLLTLLIVGAALITLIVGGVGIMNVMLVSVTERMHEIGIRKAIGATNRQIMRQFIAEAFVLSAYGSVVGVVCSVIGIYLLRLFTSLHPVFVWQAMVIAPVVAIVTGLFFGSMPALKAARKDPIDALRHE